MSGEVIDVDGDIEYRVLTKSDRENIKGLYFYFLRNEPGARSVGGLSEDEMEVVFNEIQYSVASGLSIGAVDRHTGAIVGARMALVTTRDRDHNLREKKYPVSTPRLDLLRKVWHAFTLDVFGVYNVDKCVRYTGLMVLDEYTNRGIASRLSEVCLALYDRMGLPVVLTYASNTYTRKIFDKQGFKTLDQVTYADLRKSIPELDSALDNEVLSFHVMQLSNSKT